MAGINTFFSLNNTTTEVVKQTTDCNFRLLYHRYSEMSGRHTSKMIIFGIGLLSYLVTRIEKKCN